jgi:hypothetical protein
MNGLFYDKGALFCARKTQPLCVEPRKYEANNQQNTFNSEEFCYVKCKKPRNEKKNLTSRETVNREMELWRNGERNSGFGALSRISTAILCRVSPFLGVFSPFLSILFSVSPFFYLMFLVFLVSLI